MAHNLLERYIWLVDTIRRHGRISRAQLDDLWRQSPHSDGNPLPRRTFYSYRQAIAELFNVEILCDTSTYEYYLSDYGDQHSESVTKWLINSVATNDLLAGNRDIASKIFLENIPSAREHLPYITEALRHNRPIKFDYHPFGRITGSTGVDLEPYFIKLFRQRWYVTGREIASDKVKTYALDRMSNLTIGLHPFKPDSTFDPEEYTRHNFGIITTHGQPRHVAIQVDPRQAQYFRALPLHASQQESVHDNFSIFHYTIRLSDDLVNELLSYGSRIRVLEPPELIEMLRLELHTALTHYTPAPELSGEKMLKGGKNTGLS